MNQWSNQDVRGPKTHCHKPGAFCRIFYEKECTNWEEKPKETFWVICHCMLEWEHLFQLHHICLHNCLMALWKSYW